MNKSKAKLSCLILRGVALALLILCLVFAWPSRKIYGYDSAYGAFDLWACLSYDGLPGVTRVMYGAIFFSLVLAIVCGIAILVLTLMRKKTLYWAIALIAFILFFGFNGGNLLMEQGKWDPSYSLLRFLLPSYLAGIVLGIAEFVGRRLPIKKEKEDTEQSKHTRFVASVSLLSVALLSGVVFFVMLWPGQKMFCQNHTNASTELFAYLGNPYEQGFGKALVLLAYFSLLASLVLAIFALVFFLRNKRCRPFAIALSICFFFAGFFAFYGIGIQGKETAPYSFLFFLPAGVGVISAIVFLSLSDAGSKAAVRKSKE